jgi:uncharacterized protein DUF6518
VGITGSWLAPRREVAASPAACAAVVAGVGLAVGAATSVLQAYASPPWLSLVNSASPWLAGMFVTGPLWRRPWPAAAGGTATGLLELVGYYVTAAARGYPAGTSILLFWGACAVIGGPLAGLAGWAWWRGPLGALGGSFLPGAFLAEAAVTYAWRLHYLSSALLFVVTGAAVFALAGLRGRRHGRMAVWLPVVFAAGVAAELVLGLVYSQSF